MSVPTEQAVVEVLASRGELGVAELAAAVGRGRSAIGKALGKLERAGRVRRHPGGRQGGRRAPDRWSLTATEARRGKGAGVGLLRPGELDGLVLDFLNAQGKDAALGPTAVAKGLGRSAGAVGNCLARLAAAGQVRQVSDRPRRYSSAPTRSRQRAAARRARKGGAS